MNIGIVTQPLMHNIGGILQNFALQNVLRSFGHNPVTLDFINPDFGLFSKGKTILKNTAISLLNTLIGSKFRTHPVSNKRSNEIIDFISRYITTTKTLRSYNGADIHDFDCIIVGSDQVWRPIYNNEIENMFLAFIPNNIKKISYAASLGGSYWEFTPYQTSKIKNLLARFDAISVREQSAVELLHDNIDIQATKVLDPTILISPEIYMSAINDYPVPKREYIGAYFLDRHKNEHKMLSQISKSANHPIKMFDLSKTDIKAWLAMYRDASCIITDSFHSTVFALLFGKSFVVMTNNTRGTSRIYDLLEPLGLSNRIFTDTANPALIPTLLNDNIDWDKVNTFINKEKNKSLQWLSRALTN